MFKQIETSGKGPQKKYSKHTIQLSIVNQKLEIMHRVVTQPCSCFSANKKSGLCNYFHLPSGRESKGALTYENVEKEQKLKLCTAVKNEAW